MIFAIANPLRPIENIMTTVLEWIHSTMGLPWAWAIIVLTLMVRIVIVPLTVKQIRSMQHLQAHAPELKALQQKYKHDKQRMNEEVMKFYRENKINPAASCLPVLIQIPVFISLYYVLKDFEKEVFPQYPGSDLGWLGIVPNITTNITDHWSGWLLLVDLRRQPGGLDLLHVHDDGPAPAVDLHGAAVRLRPLHRQRVIPGRAPSLLGDDEPLDGRPGARDAAADAETAGRAEALVPDSAEGGPPPKTARPRSARRPQPSRATSGQQRVKRRKKKGPRSRR